MATVTTERSITDWMDEENSIAKLSGRLGELNARKADLDIEAQAVDEQLGGLMADRAQGLKVSAGAFTDLETQQRENAVESSRVRMELQGIQERIEDLRTRSAERNAALCLARIERLAPKAVKQAQVVIDALKTLADATDALHVTRRQLLNEQRDYVSYAPHRPHGIEFPREIDFEISAEYLREGEGLGGHTLRYALDHWLDKPRREAEERERQHDAYVASAEATREREERFLAGAEMPSWAIPDSWQEEFAQPVGQSGQAFKD